LKERLLDRCLKFFDRVYPYLKILCRRLIEFLNDVDEARLEVTAAYTDLQPIGGLGTTDRGAK
jgi:hypothetical protein